MTTTRPAALLACAWLATLGPPMVLAAPRCTKTCRLETARCATTQCTTSRGKARRDCLETCRGIGGCADVGTFAYVMSQCTAHAFHQTLQIRRGSCDPVTVLNFPEPVEGSIDCTLIGDLRLGLVSSPTVGAFHRMGVTPDGRHVVFEIKDDFSVLHIPLVPPGQQEGIFVVRADGRRLRWLAPASRDPSFRFALDPNSGVRGGAWTSFSFGPDGRSVALTDLGPGPNGEEAVQIFTLDIETGQRTQRTRLLAVGDRNVGTTGLFPGTSAPVFLPDGRISFQSFGNLDRKSNPDGNLAEWIIDRDGSISSVPRPAALPGSRVVTTFGITGGGARQRVDLLSVPGTPVNPQADLTGNTISEVFFVDGNHFLQLTTFRRVDTIALNLTPDGQRVLFAASANLGDNNPEETCQLFSISTLKTGLRQLTHFSQPEHSYMGCNALSPPGCSIQPGGLDPATDTLLFYSSCDPFGTNPYGDQLFAIRTDGTRLRQLTHARGRVTEADGSISSENIGPIGTSFVGPPPGSAPQ